MVRKRINKVKIGLCVAAVALVVAAIVGLVMFWQNRSENAQLGQKTDFGALQIEVQKLAEGRAATEKFLDLQVKTIKLSKEEQQIVADFEITKPDVVAVAKLLQQIRNADDSEVDRMAEEVASAETDLLALYEVEQDIAVMFDGELSDQDLKKLSKSDNEYLVGIGKDLSEYREKVRKLSENDADFEANQKKLLETGKKLEKQYEDVKLTDIIGKSREEILAFYDKVDELNNYLIEREQK